MKSNKLTNILAIVIMSTIAFTSCKDANAEAEQRRLETERIEMEASRQALEAEAVDLERRAKENEARANSIAGIAKNNNELTSLVSALKAANLAFMLTEPGNYTVFAPSNQAFEKLPKAEREELMKPENKQMLTGVLQNHVVSGKITSDQMADAIKNNKSGYKVKTITGEELTFTMKGDQFIINDGSGKKAQVILGNQEASNGIIYIIDTVLMPKQ